MGVNDQRNQLYNDFLNEFPLESLKIMPIDKYTNLNRSGDDYFCYWLENKTKELGSISGGSSYKFGIYRYNKKPNNPSVIESDNEYAWYKWYNARDRNEAYEITLRSIINIAQAASVGDFERIEEDSTLGEVFKWKIAFLYSNKKLIPIYKKEMLKEIAKELEYVGNLDRATMLDLQKFLIEKKGDKDLFEYYDELLKLCPNNRWSFVYSTWDDAIIRVLGDSEMPLKATDVLKIILDNQLYTTKGLTPERTISSMLTQNSKLYYRSCGNACYLLSDLGEQKYRELIGNVIVKEKENKIDSGVVGKKSSEDYYDKKSFLNEVFMKNDEYERLSNLLLRKKNIILQGAPGVGKTFAAKRLAYSLVGEKREDRVCCIQFHQNYTYEDFIMGYKPEDDKFVLRKGVFYDFCILAKNNPNDMYFLIIDEINRGNLSKIFGELLMLIENDHRGESLKLAYNGEEFCVPKNLYIIGMMNTADRSLAMIDYALRRRFSFFEMKPGFDSDGFKKLMKEANNEIFGKLIDQIKSLNEEIEKDDSLGPGFEIGHSYFCYKDVDEVTEEWIKAIVDYDIIPTLQEYWFDDKLKINNWSEKLRGVFVNGNE